MTSAEAIIRMLGGAKAGSGWMACCPAHEDRQPSLAIDEADGRLLVHCHAGCDQMAVINALRRRGLWSGTAGADRRNPCGPRPARQYSEHSSRALAIWDDAVPAPGTQVVTYLAARELTLPPPASLRFHHGLKHPSGGRWPCMIALVTRGEVGAPAAIHRTYLSRDGSGKAPVDPDKMMLGPCRGGAIRLGDPEEVLMVGEGIETCLSAVQATGLPAWAALSTSGMRALDLPQSVREVIVLADGDDPGEAAARDAAQRWKCEGRRVRIAQPPRGMDFNDLLMGKTPVEQGGKR